MTRPLSPGATIGIVGGGQLGRMLAIAAARLGYRTAVLEPEPDCPAGQVANIHIAAPYEDSRGLEQLAAASDVVTYEFENIPGATARSLADRVPVHPLPEALETAQDRLSEKIFFNSLGIATAPFVSVENDDDLAQGLARLGGNGVLKTRRMGYDGKGQRVFHKATAKMARGTVAAMGGGLILEGLVHFEREISIIAARGADGSFAAYNAAENVHKNGILVRSTVPAAVPRTTAEAARRAAFTILESLGYVGVVGIEFFVLKGGTLLANEMAPRVHNSGHWTEAACTISQFEQHIRAVAGLPLGSTARHHDCVMENILGTDQEDTLALLGEPNLLLHLYGKTEPRPGRKMGHVTRLYPLGAGRAASTGPGR